MLTTTHVALAGAVERWTGHGAGRGARALRRLLPTTAGRVALVIGGGLPDLPLVGALVVAVVAALIGGEPVGVAIDTMLDDTFPASRPLVLAHVALQAPVVLAAVLVAGLLTRGPAGPVLRGVAAGALLHSAVDVFTHADGGPLLLWPFTWAVQFHAPVSWSAPARFGVALLVLDVVLTFALGGWLVTRWWHELRRWRAGRAATSAR